MLSKDGRDILDMEGGGREKNKRERERERKRERERERERERDKYVRPNPLMLTCRPTLKHR